MGHDDRLWHPSLLSFIPPSCMVAPNREIVDINLSSYNSAMSNSMGVNAIPKDINMDEPRGRSPSSSLNAPREMLAHSDLSSISYMDRMEVQSNDSSQFNQTEQEHFQLSYPTSKGRVPNVQNKANDSNNMPLPHVENTDNNTVNIDQPHGFDLSSILYEEA